MILELKYYFRSEEETSLKYMPRLSFFKFVLKQSRYDLNLLYEPTEITIKILNENGI